jgi:uncharacterized repeat protein (TIGR02543 family)
MCSTLTKPDDPEKPDYAFAGWYRDDGTFTDPWDFANDTVQNSQTLYAKWNPYITFAAAGGAPAPNPIAISEGSHVPEPPSPNLAGWTFDGWHTAPLGGNLWVFNTNTVSSPMTLYAKWITLVLFDANSGSPVPAAQTIVKGDPALEKAILPPQPDRANFRFAGWFTDPACTDLWSFDDPVPGAMTLYAKWISLSWVIVTFHSDGGSLVVPQSLPLGSAVARPKNPSLPSEQNKVLDDWYAHAPGRGLDEPWDFETPVMEDLDLYARWRCAGGYHLEGEACVRDVCGPNEMYMEGIGCIPACPWTLGSAQTRQRARRPGARGVPTIALKSFSARDALMNVMGSISLEEAALSHLLNAEGEKIQHFLLEVPPDTTNGADGLIDLNASVGDMVRQVGWMEGMLHQKLFLSVSGLPTKVMPLTVRKVDDRGDPVKGAEFVLTGEGVEREAVSDANGMLLCECMTPGVYKIREVSAPTGYILDETVHTLTVAMDGTMRLDGKLGGELVNWRV